jgi:hypothetical protein
MEGVGKVPDERCLLSLNLSVERQAESHFNHAVGALVLAIILRA